MSVFSPTKKYHTQQPMFLGEPVDVARYDTMKYPWIDALTEKQLSFFWRPEEFDLSKDAVDFRERLDEAEKHVFVANLKYQILLDSVQGRAPVLAFGSIASLPELETWIVTWSFSETIHSRSYTHIIRNVFTDPSEVLDDITVIPEILDRAKAVTAEYDKLIAMNERRSVPIQEHRRQVVKTLASVNILEAIRFYVSFACAWSFNERGLMEGNSKIITSIARDEALHLSGTQLMLKKLMEGEEGEEWRKAAECCSGDIIRLFDDAVQQEKAWAEYLFNKGSIIGLNAAILGQYIEYIANVRLRALGISPLYVTTTNPLPWTNAYMNRNTVQVAPQEVEIANYLTGAVDSTVDVEQLKGLSL